MSPYSECYSFWLQIYGNIPVICTVSRQLMSSIFTNSSKGSHLDNFINKMHLSFITNVPVWIMCGSPGNWWCRTEIQIILICILQMKLTFHNQNAPLIQTSQLLFKVVFLCRVILYILCLLFDISKMKYCRILVTCSSLL